MKITQILKRWSFWNVVFSGLTISLALKRCSFTSFCNDCNIIFWQFNQETVQQMSQQSADIRTELGRHTQAELRAGVCWDCPDDDPQRPLPRGIVYAVQDIYTELLTGWKARREKILSSNILRQLRQSVLASVLNQTTAVTAWGLQWGL